MEKELNIAAILKEKSKGTRLWSDTFGYVHLLDWHSDFFDVKDTIHNLSWRFSSDGSLKDYKGSLSIYPAQYMRDWSKFAWKKGDVLTTKTGSLTVVFDYFNTEYMSFAGKYSFCSYQEEKEDDQWKKDGENSYKTNCFHKVSYDEAKEFIEKIEEHYGGKLNLETLEIEHPKPEFKDGDVVAFDKSVAICRHISEHTIYFYACISKTWGLMINDNSVSCSYRLATDSEKQQLFDALAKEGKKWNPDTLQIEDLPKKCEFEPFQKVLVRDYDNEKWSISFFDSYSKEMEDDTKQYKCLGFFWAYCIPYNEETKHLLGTTDEWKGGEG